MTTNSFENDQSPVHLLGLLRHFADLHNLVFQSDYRIVPAITHSSLAT